MELSIPAALVAGLRRAAGHDDDDATRERGRDHPDAADGARDRLDDQRRRPVRAADGFVIHWIMMGTVIFGIGYAAVFLAVGSASWLVGVMIGLVHGAAVGLVFMPMMAAMHPRMSSAPTGANGYRDYPADAVDRLAFIRHAQAAGLTLRQIREILEVRDGGRAPCHHVVDVVAQRLDEVERRLQELQQTREKLLELNERLEDLDPADCPPSAICAAIARD